MALLPNSLSGKSLQPFNPSTLQPFNPSTLQPFNPSTLQPFNLSTFQLFPLDFPPPFPLGVLCEPGAKLSCFFSDNTQDFSLCVFLLTEGDVRHVVKISTVREVQHNFAALLRLVQRGEEIEVFSRKKAVGRIVPPQAAQLTNQFVDWSDLKQRLEGIWKGVDVHSRSTDEVLDELRGER